MTGTEQKEFLESYKQAVTNEAEYIHESLRVQAAGYHFEGDLFVEDVLKEIKRIAQKEEKE